MRRAQIGKDFDSLSFYLAVAVGKAKISFHFEIADDGRQVHRGKLIIAYMVQI